MRDAALHQVVRRLARDHWVRVHGTSRVTILVGASWARQIWTEWTGLMRLSAPLFDGGFDAALDAALAIVARELMACVAVLAPRASIAAWSAGRSDRKRAMVD